MNLILGALLVLSFVLYSVSLWGTGYFQLREITEEQKALGKMGHDTIYITFVAITLISLILYFGMNFYISSP